MTTRWGAAFVCQGGALERKAAVLAASLRRHNGSSVQLVAAVPGPSEDWPQPSQATLAYLDRLGVRIEPVENAIGRHYPIGNKLGALAALAALPTADVTLLLDSDLMCLAPLDDGARPVVTAAAKPEDRPGPWSDRRSWRRLYRWAGLPEWSEHDEVVTTVSGHRLPPYFNAGVVALDPSSGMAEAWLQWARRIDAADELPFRYPWLDQISLPLAARELGVDIGRLDPTWNWPVHHWLVRGRPRLAHYHQPLVIEEDPTLLAGLHDLVDADDELAGLLADDEEWLRVLQRRTAVPRSDLVVLAARPRTGIQDALESFEKLGFGILQADDAFVRRTRRDPDITGAGTWLRRFWLAHDPRRSPLVIWDESTLARDAGRMFSALDGFTVALWSADGAGHSPRWPFTKRAARPAPVLRAADLVDQAALDAWSAHAGVAASARLEALRRAERQ